MTTTDPVPNPTARPHDPAERCDVQFQDDRTCTKPAGHWTPKTQDPHTAEQHAVLESPDPAPGAEVAYAVDDDAAREEQQDRAIARRAHAAGDHQWCDVTCETTYPSESLRAGILCRAIPGSNTMLAELERRAAAGQEAAVRAAAFREAAALAHAEGNRLYDDSGQRHAQGAWAVRNALSARAAQLAPAGGES